MYLEFFDILQVIHSFNSLLYHNLHVFLDDIVVFLEKKSFKKTTKMLSLKLN